MSVAMTKDAVHARQKTVTRRAGWWEDKNGRRLLKAGDRLTLCEKVQGRKKGEPLVRICDVEVVGVRRETLGLLSHTWLNEHEIPEPYLNYGKHEVRREGFPGMHPDEFIRRYFTDAQGIEPDAEITRIEWRYL
jgi:hypothetical protein